MAELLQHGLLKASYIPEQAQRELREFVRYRSHLIEERSREVNRLQKVLEDANLKLGSVATDVLGVSGRAMIEGIIAGQEDAAVLAQLAKARMRPKIAELQRALVGRVRDSHRLLLQLHLEHIDDLDAKIARLDEEIGLRLPPFDQHDLIARLDEITGVGRHVAEVIVAEVGVDMTRFANADHLASWASLAPGKNESAGRNRSARVPHGNRYLRTALIEAAHAAGHTKHTYLGAQFRRLAARRGTKRAAVAVAHSIIVIAYHIIRDGTHYLERGPTYFDQRKAETIQRQLVRRLEQLGLKVTLDHPAA